MKRLLLLGVTAAATALVVRLWPDISRYLRIREM